MAIRKIYNYFLFRIYNFYTDTLKEKHVPVFSTASVMTVLLFIPLISLETLLKYYDLIEAVNFNKLQIALIMLPVMLIIYNNAKSRDFLNYGFTKDKKGGWLIILYVIVNTMIFITIANFNRAKIFLESQAQTKEITISE